MSHPTASGGDWEERWHPLREEWVIIAAHRQGRPWLGASVPDAGARPPAYDANRKRTRYHSALAPSRQVTFFPSSYVRPK